MDGWCKRSLKAMVERSRNSNPAWFLQWVFAEEGDGNGNQSCWYGTLNIEQTFNYNSWGNAIVFQFVWLPAGEINQ